MSERTFAIPGWGLVHLENERFAGLAWCGVKAQHRHRYRYTTDRSEITCPRCRRQIAQDRPLSWKARR